MAKATPPYKRLPGTGYHYRIPPWVMVPLFFVMGIFVLLFRGRRTQLWVGAEHLLIVESDGYTEYYKRFDYRDIQAFLIRKTAEGAIATALLGGIALFLFSLVVLAVDDAFARGFLFTLAGFFALLLLNNVLRGPTCRCQLRTAVQTVEMVSLTRVRTARKVLTVIRPQIERTQGPASPVPSPSEPGLAGGTPEAPA